MTVLVVEVVHVALVSGGDFYCVLWMVRKTVTLQKVNRDR